MNNAAAAVDLSVVIVSWNVAGELSDCLKSLDAEGLGDRMEIIVVDNASTDGTTTLVSGGFPHVRLTASTVNLGFGRGSNLGMKMAAGRYLLILNPDTVVRPGAVTTMFRFLEEHADVGIVGPILEYPNGEIQTSSARLLPTLGTALFVRALRFNKIPWVGRYITRKFVGPYSYAKTEEVEAVTGAAMMIRREVIDEIGGFGDSFLHCGEDTDLCAMAGRAGWKIYFHSGATILHYQGRSSDQDVVRTSVNAALSIEEYFGKQFGQFHALMYRWIVRFIQVPMDVVIALAVFARGSEPRWKTGLRFAAAAAMWRWKPVTKEVVQPGGMGGVTEK